MNAKLAEKLAVVACIDPDAYTTGAQTSDWVDMSKFQDGVVFIVQAGTLGSGGILNFKVQEATSNAGAGAQDLSGKSIMALTQAGTDADKQSLVNVSPEELSAGFGYVAGIATLTGANSDFGVVAVAAGARYAPASDYDLASVDEIVL